MGCKKSHLHLPYARSSFLGPPGTTSIAELKHSPREGAEFEMNVGIEAIRFKACSRDWQDKAEGNGWSVEKGAALARRLHVT